MKTGLTLSCIFLLAGIMAFGQTVPSGFTVSTIASGWTAPVGTAFSSDGQKLFVWEKAGKVYVCNRNGAGTYVKQTTPVIDISEEVGDWRDHGLLGFALDPQFLTNGYIYLLYNVDRHHLLYYGTGTYNSATNEYFNATIGRVTRYKTITSGTNLVTDYSTRNVLVGETKQTGIPLLYESHGVGALAFAADGTLLISAGDGASYNTTDPGSISHTYFVQAQADGIIRPEENCGAFRSQLLNSHCGKLLRIDPTNGNGVGSNPFYSAASPRSAKSRVWALGFRNPFRITIKPGTGSTNPSAGDIGEVYVGDVGWNVWEEFTELDKPGMNAGWPLFEGHTTLASYYNLSTPNQDEPNPLAGGGCPQFFTFKELLKQATADNIKTIYNPCNPAQAIGTNERYFHRRPVIDWKHGEDNARVGTFSGNNASTALIGTPASGVTGSPFRGNASVAGCWYTGTSYPVQYRNTFFQADYGGQWLKSFTVNFTDVLQRVDNFATGFLAIVSITQNPLDGSLFCVDLGNSTIKRIAYGGNQAPVVVMTSDKTFGPTVLGVNFTGNGSFDPTPGGSIASYSWNFGDGTPNSTAANPSHNFSAPPNTPTKYVTKLTVTDNQGATAVDSIIISVNNTPPEVNITSPVNNSTYTLGPDTLYSCTATVTDAQHSGAQLTYAWQSFLKHNNHQHPESVVNSVAPQTLISRIGCNGDDYHWLIKLTVTDAAGLSTSDTTEIYPGCSNSPLALVLKSFSVTQQETENLVKWTTEQEEDVDHFELERSTDRVNFIPVFFQAARNIASVSTYTYTDNNFPPGINYYRLKIVEKDGAVKYSIIIQTISAKGASLSIAPNPVSDVFSLNYDSPARGKAVISIRDIHGRLIYTANENVSKGNNVIYIQSQSNLLPGIYFISLQQGGIVLQGKFIKM